jgi:hypothetical protein
VSAPRESTHPPDDTSDHYHSPGSPEATPGECHCILRLQDSMRFTTALASTT